MITKVLETIRQILALTVTLFRHPKRFLQFGLAALALLIIAALVFGVLGVLVLSFLKIDPKSFVAGRFGAARVGLVRYEPKFDLMAEERIKLIEDAQTEVFFVGVNFYRTLPKSRDTILKRLENGVRFRFLIAADATYTPANASLFGDTVEVNKAEYQETLEGYRNLSQQRQKQGYSGTLEMRQIDRVFPNAFYFSDHHTPSGHLLLVARDFGKDSTEMPAFLFLNVAGGALPRYSESAEELWRLASPVAEK